MILRIRKAERSRKLNRVQQAAHILLKRSMLKIETLCRRPQSALGAGGRAFKSPRPDQIYQ